MYVSLGNHNPCLVVGVAQLYTCTCTLYIHIPPVTTLTIYMYMYILDEEVMCVLVFNFL